MPVQSVVVRVDGVPQDTVFSTALQAYTTVIPVQVAPYAVATSAVDVGGSLNIAISFVTLGANQVVTLTATDAAAAPVTGVLVTAHYQNPTDKTDYGRADAEVTDAVGRADLFLLAGSYNLQIVAAGFITERLVDLQVLNGIAPFVSTGGTIPEAHVLRDNNGVAVASARIKVLQNDLALGPNLVACAVTGIDGSWSIPLISGKAYTFMFEKPAYDLVRTVIQNG